MRNLFKNNSWAIIITIILFIIPFFWLKPGEMDMGGDGNRLYYYDPQSYLLHDALYMSDNVVESIRTIEPHFYYIPYILLLWGIKTIIPSSYFLIEFINGLKLSLSFLFVYLIIRTILQNSYKEKKDFALALPSILGGLFYITTPIMIGNYDKALISQNQVFLNPLLFYLFLTYFLKQKFRYLVLAIVISVIFTPNFSWVSAPPFFAFFPLAFLFVLLYILFVLKKRITFSHILMGILLLIGLHAFHLIPEIYSLVSPGSYVNERVFNKDNITSQLNYFYGVLPTAKLSLNILINAPFKEIGWSSVIPSFFVLLGFVFNKSKNRTYLLSGIFFLITMYLVTANITDIGIKLYAFFFSLPGFSMFRNFIGQWAFVFSFFYALLFGQSIYLVYQKIKKRLYHIMFTALIGALFIISAWAFFSGNLVNKTHFQSDNVKIAMSIDPAYEKTLVHIRSLKDDGAILSFPFTDCCYSVVHGTNNGAYVGPSPLTGLTGRKDYNGYGIIAPFGQVLLPLVKEGDYESIKKLAGLLNVKYIFYNSDPRVYNTTFSGFPYNTVRNYFPATQKGYKTFIHEITTEKIYEEGPYQLYEINNTYSQPHFFLPQSLKIYDNKKDDWYGRTMSFFINDKASSSAYVESDVCRKSLSIIECKKMQSIKKRPLISFERINPTKYLVHVKGAKAGYLLVFSETYHRNWDINLVTNNKSNFLENFVVKHQFPERQLLVNGYANAWEILPKDVNNKSDYTLSVEMTEQKIFNISLVISLVTLVFFTITLVGIHVYKIYYKKSL